MLNVVALQGRLTATPELKKTQNGTSVTSFTLAVESEFKGATGEYGCYFVDCVAWRGSAEYLARHFQKGQLVAISGNLTTRTWEDETGRKRKTTEVVAQSVHFCGRSAGDQSAAPSPAPAPAPAAPTKEKQQHLPGTDSVTGFYPVADDDDIPF